MKNSSLILLLLFFYSCNESNNQFIEKQTWEIINNGADSILAEKIIYDNEYIKHYFFNEKISDTNAYIIMKNNLIVKEVSFSDGKPYLVQDFFYNSFYDIEKIEKYLNYEDIDTFIEVKVNNLYKNNKLSFQSYSNPHDGIINIKYFYSDKGMTKKINEIDVTIIEKYNLDENIVEKILPMDTIYYEYKEKNLVTVKSKLKMFNYKYDDKGKIILEEEFYIFNKDTNLKISTTYEYNEYDSISNIKSNMFNELRNYYYFNGKTK